MRSRLLALPFVFYVACTGETPPFSADDSQSGTDGGNPPPTQQDGGDTKNPSIQLEGQRLVLTAGTNDTLQFKVVAAHDVGDLNFKVSGLPEGVSTSSVVTLPANADSLNVQLGSLPSTKHGDYTVTVTADGLGTTATATLAVRGTPGAVDSGFGSDGTQLLPGMSSALRVIGLANDTIVVGGSAGSKPTLILIDGTGSPTSVKTVKSSVGTALVDLAPTADGGFVALVSATNELRLVWFSSTGTEASPNVLVSTVTAPTAKIAATPKGTLFAQAKTNAAVTVARYGVGAVDSTFTTATVPSAENQARVAVLGGKSDGAVGLGLQVGVSQEQLVHIDSTGTTQLTRLYLSQEGCGTGGVLADDLLVRCAADGPLFTIRRFTFTPTNTVDFASAFGTNGTLTYTNAGVQAISGSGADKLFISTVLNSTTLRTTAYGGNGAVRTVFGTSGRIEVSGDDTPFVGVDARGRLVYATHVQTTESQIRVSRFWD